ncbi:t-SNARE [Trametes elegans]|nr:t-SNARE [Trametes elegans]
MSFQDIEAGMNQRPLSPGVGVPQSPEESAFLSLQKSLSLQVFKINSNVQGILKLVDQLGTARDSATLRKSLHDLTESTRSMAKRGSDDLKKLAALQATLPQYKMLVQKTSHDFQLSLVAFQRAQQVSAERQRTVVEGVKHAVEEEEAAAAAYHERASSPTPSQRQAQILQNQLSPQELAFQESMIQEREAEIREIETGIHELSQIFRDLGTLVQEQGGMLDNIESNISSIAVDTAGAAEELTSAHEYQRRAGRRALCLMLVLVIVVCVVLLAVRIILIVARCSAGIPMLC